MSDLPVQPQPSTLQVPAQCIQTRDQRFQLKVYWATMSQTSEFKSSQSEVCGGSKPRGPNL